eukprot:1158638-Pelagomonas_calceolata.AAC.8
MTILIGNSFLWSDRLCLGNEAAKNVTQKVALPGDVVKASGKHHAGESQGECGNEPAPGGEPVSLTSRIKSSFTLKRPPSVLNTRPPPLQVLSLTSTAPTQQLPSACSVKGWGVVQDEARESALYSKSSSPLDSSVDKSPRLILLVWCIEQLARLHPRVLEQILPQLLTLSSPDSPNASCDARSAVAGYWQLQEALGSAGKEAARGLEASLHPLPEAGESEDSLFLQPIAINTAAEVLLGCSSTPSECAGIIAQQLQFQGQAPCQQAITTSTHESSSSLAAVLFDVAAHTLRCSPSIPAAEPLAHSSGHLAAGNKPHTAGRHLPKQAKCGDGLVANVEAAYCMLPGGLLQPVLVLEHAAVEAAGVAAVGVQHGPAGACGPNESSFHEEANLWQKSDGQLPLTLGSRLAASAVRPKDSSGSMPLNKAKLPLPPRPPFHSSQPAPPSSPVHPHPAVGAPQQQLLHGPMGSFRESMRIMLQGGAPLLTLAGSKNEGASAPGPHSPAYLAVMVREAADTAWRAQPALEDLKVYSSKPLSALPNHRTQECHSCPLALGRSCPFLGISRSIPYALAGSARVTPTSVASPQITPGLTTLSGSSPRDRKEPRAPAGIESPVSAPHSTQTLEALRSQLTWAAHANGDHQLLPDLGAAMPEACASLEGALHVHPHDFMESRLGRYDRSDTVPGHYNTAPASPGGCAYYIMFEEHGLHLE